MGQDYEEHLRDREGGPDRQWRRMRRVWRPGRQILERLPEVRCRVRLVLLLCLLRRLFRLWGVDLQRVRAARLRAQDRHGVVELLGPFATLDAHPTVRTILRV